MVMPLSGGLALGLQMDVVTRTLRKVPFGKIKGKGDRKICIYIYIYLMMCIYIYIFGSVVSLQGFNTHVNLHIFILYIYAYL